MEFKNFSDWLGKLRSLSEELAVIVEGKNDLRALSRYGVKNVITLSGKRFSDIPDLLEGRFRGAVLLLDLDPKGERMNRKLGELLTSQGFLVNEDFREYLRQAGIIHIEELAEAGNGKDQGS